MAETKNENVEKTVKADKTEKTRKNKKDEEIAKLKQQLENEHNLLLRTAAEFDNYKKRTDRERIFIGEYAKADIIKKLLPVIDNVARSGESDTSNPEYIKGIELITKQLSSLQESLGIIPIAKIGDKFDPILHEAVMHTEDEQYEENTISQVLQQGYTIGETVIRTAMVCVVN